MPFTAQDIRAARLHLQKTDPVLKKIIRRVGPFRCKVNRDRFQMLVHSIISQQISGAAAQTIQGRLQAAVEPEKVTPETILEFDLGDLRELGVSRQKASYLFDLAQKVQSGQLKLNALSRKKDSAVVQELVQVNGIGVWTAQMFLMFSLARLDVFPVDDLGIRNAIRKSFRPKHQWTRTEMLKLADSWRPYTTVASWYLWQSLEIQENLR
ncbi:MAG: DNA-3-methyladenine glycosylase [Mariniblastus sp.]|nr:DNA-3-methyladenine glycosylase [Mariniblastus sp.]